MRWRHSSFRWICSASGATLALVFFLTTHTSIATAQVKSEIIVAYLFPQDRVLTAAEVSAKKMDRINYAFANIKGGEVVEGFAHDTENFALLNSLKQENPSLTVVVSVGGWAWSGDFSDMAVTRKGRRRFIESAVRFVKQYNLDGLDIDWEYPGMKGMTARFRPEDKQNYTRLLKELRKRFDKEGKKLHKHLVTSIATGSSMKWIDHTEMAKVQRYVDTVNLMAYDFYGPDSDKTTGHHSPLFTNPADPKKISSDRSVQEYLQAGVPAEKICLGVPFYGKAWTGVVETDHGLFQAAEHPAPHVYLPYSKIAGLLADGYIRYWDPISSVPYLYDPGSRTFVTYEDVESLAKKSDYVLSHHLAGMMFWEYTNDPSGVLLDAINAGLHRGTATERP
jgi:chitinase